MRNWTAQHIEAGHYLCECLFTRKCRAEICPIVADNFAELAKSGEVDLLFRAQSHARIELALNILLDVIPNRLRYTFCPPIFSVCTLQRLSDQISDALLETVKQLVMPCHPGRFNPKRMRKLRIVILVAIVFGFALKIQAMITFNFVEFTLHKCVRHAEKFNVIFRVHFRSRCSLSALKIALNTAGSSVFGSTS